MKIPYEVVGSIVNTDKVSHHVKVSNDATNTGGFLIFEWWQGSNGPNEHSAFDDWVPDELALQGYFQESGWQVNWSA